MRAKKRRLAQLTPILAPLSLLSWQVWAASQEHTDYWTADGGGGRGTSATAVSGILVLNGTDGQHPVALTGRVQCKVDASFGAVEPGDLLTTSDTPGHAMKVTDHAQATGAILGKAMTTLDSCRGEVLVLVSLQ